MRVAVVGTETRPKSVRARLLHITASRRPSSTKTSCLPRDIDTHDSDTRDVLELFRPQEATQVERIAQALRLRHRSRYQVAVCWEGPGAGERFGELTADPVSDTVEETPACW